MLKAGNKLLKDIISTRVFDYILQWVPLFQLFQLLSRVKTSYIQVLAPNVGTNIKIPTYKNTNYKLWNFDI